MSVQLEERPKVEVARPKTDFTPSNRQGMLHLWKMRHLISVMVKRDLLGRYRGSLMGLFWTVINPLGHMMLYTFVFSVVLKVKFGTDSSIGSFALYLMAGLLPWGALAESLSRSTTAVIEQPNLVKRVVFPLEILPLSVVVSSMLSAIIGTTILIIVAACLGHTMHATIAFLPLILLSQFLFVGGISWLFGSLGVYLPDLRHVMSLALATWMYTTPIIYPASALPKNLSFLLWVNPMAGIVTDYRRVLLEGLQPDWPLFAIYTTVGLIVWCAGFYFFNKTKRSFADVV